MYIDENDLEKAKEISKLGWSKERIENLYRGENYFSAQKISQIMSEEIPFASLKTVYSLLKFFDIRVWSKDETEMVKKREAYTHEKLIKKIETIEENGFTKDYISDLYWKEELSRTKILEEINASFGRGVLNKTWMKLIFDELDIKERTREENEIIRIRNIKDTYNSKPTILDKVTDEQKKNILDLYCNQNMSLEKIHSTLNISVSLIKKIIAENNIPIKKQIEYKDILEIFKQKNINKEDIKKYYITEGHSQNDLKDFIKEKTGYTVGDKVIANLLKTYDIKKTVEDIKKAQGSKSRKEKAVSMTFLEKAGYKTADEIAKYYEDTKTLTLSSLANELNETLGRKYFTERWLARHVLPLVSKERLMGGTSRLEKEIIKFIDEQTDKEIFSNDRTLIKPYEVDCYIPELKLAFEVNGTYWHNDKFLMASHGLTAEDYHILKSDLCFDKDVQLLFIWEEDWRNDEENMKKYISKAVQEKIYHHSLLRMK